MAAPLEARRLAIAAALRAVMAEPLATSSGSAEADVETVLFDAESTPEAPHRPSLREALAAEIDWDEPEHREALGELDRSPEDLSSLGDFDDDWAGPSVPPLEVTGSMSRVASMALFGHA
jgi:hypothetical protein